MKVRLKEKNRGPFSLFGHDWKLLIAGPKGEPLPPLPLSVSPNQEAFVATSAPLLEPLWKLGATKVKARVVGRWGFTTIATEPLEVPAGCDPGWAPTTEERAAFGIGKPCKINFPAGWAGLVEKVVFCPSATGAAPLTARLEAQEDGAKAAVFSPKPADAGSGSLEVSLFGARKPNLSVPMILLEGLPEASGLEVRQGETTAILKGHHLHGIQVLELGGTRFLPASKDRGDDDTLVLKAEEGKPLAGVAGSKVAATLIMASGKKSPLGSWTLMPARPRLGEAQLIPVGTKGAGLALTAASAIAPIGAPSQVNLFAAQGYRFPSDGAFHPVLRNADEPSETRPVPAAKVRALGNNKKASFTLLPSDLMGGRASGKLEVQIVDDHAGSSDWLPLPATFLDLPVIVAVQPAMPGIRLVGPALDSIEAAAFNPAGPWEKVALQIEDGHEAVILRAPIQGNICYLKVFGWPELILALQVPAPAAPAPKPAVAEAASGAAPADGPAKGPAQGQPALAKPITEATAPVPPGTGSQTETVPGHGQATAPASVQPH